MTLIQTWVGRTAISQVSDRRLTDPTTGDVKNDIYNKAVSWCGRRAVSFTGLAYIDRRQKEPVSHWIAKILADHHHLQGEIGQFVHADVVDMLAAGQTNPGSDAQPSPGQCNFGCNLHSDSAAFTWTGQQPPSLLTTPAATVSSS